MSFFSGIGAASRRGVLIKGSNYLEALSEMNTIVFDKTGTLTKGEFKVTEIHAAVGTQESLLELAALAESYSDHPISRSIKEACGHALDMNRVSDTEEISGHGVKAVIDGHVVLALSLIHIYLNVLWWFSDSDNEEIPIVSGAPL